MQALLFSPKELSKGWQDATEGLSQAEASAVSLALSALPLQRFSLKDVTAYLLPQLAKPSPLLL